MAKLSSAIQVDIVTRLACFDTPTEVREAIKENHGVELSIPQIVYYDPTTSGTDLSEKLRGLFERTRREHEAGIRKEPLARREVRIRELTKLYHLAKRRGNLVLAAQLLEQIAKEAGDYFTNRRVVSTEDPADALARELGIPAEQLRALAAGVVDPGE